MHVLDQTILGVVMLLLLGALVAVKRMATGTVLEMPHGNFLVWFANSFNLFFLLVVNPLTALLLITRHGAIIDFTRMPLPAPRLLTVCEILGLTIYVMGFLLMAWALIRLGAHYQLGGSAPRINDAFVIKGPFRLVRHPMYTAALSISLGLAVMTQSWALCGVFGIYLITILHLIPLEEEGLRQAYEKHYVPYQQQVRKLVPFVY